MSVTTDYRSCSHDAIRGLVEVVNIAVMDKFPNSRIDIDDIEQLLQALHTMQPEVVEIQLFDGFAHIIRGNWREAGETFGALAAHSLCLPDSRAMEVYSMNRGGNDDWLITANELLQDDHITMATRTLMLALKARHEIVESRKNSLGNGEFIEPESLRLLKEASQPDEPLHGRSGIAASRLPLELEQAIKADMIQRQYLRL